MSTDQLRLWPDQPDPSRKGPAELAVRRDLIAIERAGVLDQREGLAVAALAMARALDRADRKGDAWAASTAVRELRAVYDQLGPAAEPDELSDLLAQLARPEGPASG